MELGASEQDGATTRTKAPPIVDFINPTKEHTQTGSGRVADIDLISTTTVQNTIHGIIISDRTKHDTSNIY